MIVALTGFMACGKSTFGRAVAESLGRRFLDLDNLTSPGRSAGEALRSMGIEAFRECESAALSEVLSTGGDCILALGGGTVISEQNRSLLKASAKVIWLRTSMEIILSEISNSDRPLAQGLGREELESMFKEREPYYRAACDATVEINEKDIDKVVDEIVGIIEKFDK